MAALHRSSDNPAASEPRNATYRWRGHNQAGRTVRGEMEAANADAVGAALRQQGIMPASIRRRAGFGLRRRSRIRNRDLVIVTRQLATLLDAGLPLVEAVGILARDSGNPEMARILSRVEGDLRQGRTLEGSLAAHPAIFDDLYRAMVRAGEKGGVLDTVLERLAGYLEDSEALRAKIASALFYPVAVVVVAVLVTAVIMVFVVPRFEAIFAGFGANLPAATQLVISLSRGLREHWWLLLGVGIAAIFGTRWAYARDGPFRRAVDRQLLRLPLVGNVLLKGAVARTARTFATLNAAGVPMLETLGTVGRTAGNRVVQQAFDQAAEAVNQGQRLSEPLSATGIFPATVIHMIAVGEESGNLETMLAKIADFYEAEVGTAVEGFTRLLEPLIMVILGILLGGLVIALYLPIFRVGEALGG